MSTTTVKSALNNANPVDLANAMNIVGFGTILDGLSTPTTEVGLVAATHVITLGALPAIVQRVNVKTTGGGATGSYNTIPRGLTPGAGEVAVNYAAGTLTFRAADAVLTADVTYVKFPAASRTALATYLPE